MEIEQLEKVKNKKSKNKVKLNLEDNNEINEVNSKPRKNNLNKKKLNNTSK